MRSAVIEAVQLTKQYPKVRALDNLNLEVQEEECFGLLGPNGAGKTTLVKILVHLIRPTSGTARILNRPVADERIRQQIGYLPEKVKILPFLTGSEFLDYQGRLYGMDSGQRKARAEACLKQVGMHDDRDRKIAEYSKGMVQRLGLAQALLNNPSLLLLDEPAAGLDPISNKEMRDMLLQLKQRGVTIFINSHLLSEIELICDRVAILNRGKLVGSGTKEELTARKTSVEMKVEGISERLLDTIKEVAAPVTVDGNTITLSLRGSEPISILPEIIINHGAKLLSFTSSAESLEDIFYRLVKETKANE
jgi:ABC-2 type transport system ATP-binding protein